jgi:hypothetical protein
VTIASESASRERPAPVAIRQFDAQPASQLVYGFGEGWHEAEFVNDTGLLWRWTSERAVLRIEAPPHAVRLQVRGESPLRYLPRPPNVTVSAGGTTIARFTPDADFTWNIVVPADALARGGGAVTLATDRVYLPGPAEGTTDTRHLGLRIFDVRIYPVGP